MSQFLVTIKKDIDNQFPTSFNELLYIYDYTGSILFREEWGKQVPKKYNTDNKKYYSRIVGIITVLNHTLDKEGKEDIINYMFTKSLNCLKNHNSIGL